MPKKGFVKAKPFFFGEDFPHGASAGKVRRPFPEDGLEKE
jgi:hypothetical protein